MGEYAKGLETGLAAGKAYERERIIVLLEAEKCKYARCMSDPCRNCELPICDVIALIKGEQP